MYSNTLLPLDTWARFLGINPWKFAQINRAPEAPVGLVHEDDCPCLFQYNWQAGRISRSDIITAIQQAEALFAQQVGTTPAPAVVLAERHRYPSPEMGLGNTWGVMKSVLPKRSQLRRLGVLKLTSLLSGAVLKRDSVGDGSGTILDQFELTVPVPDNTPAEDIRVFFRPADADYNELNPDEHHFEIRPLKVYVDKTGGTGNHEAIIKAPAYLFVKPSLYEVFSAQCVTHAFTSYVTAVDVYQQTVDECLHGSFILKTIAGCSGVGCEEDYYPGCGSLTGDFVTLQPLECVTVDSVQTQRSYTLPRIPDEVELNYIAGFQMVNGAMQVELSNIVAMMATALLECSMNNCKCSTCSTTKFDYYREIPRMKVGEGLVGETGDQWVAAFSRASLNGLGGLEPRRGLLMGFQALDHFASGVSGGGI